MSSQRIRENRRSKENVRSSDDDDDISMCWNVALVALIVQFFFTSDSSSRVVRYRLH